MARGLKGLHSKDDVELVPGDRVEMKHLVHGGSASLLETILVELANEARLGTLALASRRAVKSQSSSDCRPSYLPLYPCSLAAEICPAENEVAGGPNSLGSPCWRICGDRSGESNGYGGRRPSNQVQVQVE